MIFVTGGTGLLGSHLLVALTKDNLPIRAIYRSEKKRDKTVKLFAYYYGVEWEKKYNLINWVKGDILDIPFLQEVMTGCTHVYHAAALVSFDRRDFSNLIKINREGTANIVNICLEKQVEKLCYVSSTAAIGGKDDGIASETSKWLSTPKTSGYSISKYNAEREVWRAIEEGLNAVIVNPSVIIGAGDWNDSSLTIFRTLEKGMKFYPPGSNATVDARDVSNIMISLMKSDIHSERFLCIGSNQSFYELMNKISKQLKVKAPSIKTSRFMVETARRLSWFKSLFSSKKPAITKETVHSLFGNKSYDSTKIKNAIGYEFKSLENSIENAVKGRIL